MEIQVRLNPDNAYICDYCDGHVYIDYPEWGMMEKDGRFIYFHLECFQIEEGLSVNEAN